MWLPKKVTDEVREVARVVYIDVDACMRWNKFRREGELRLLTGWAWIAKSNNRGARQGFKTQTVAYRDAYYTLCLGEEAVFQPRPRIRVVARSGDAKKAAA